MKTCLLTLLLLLGLNAYGDSDVDSVLLADYSRAYDSERLTEEDFIQVAQECDVEPAVIHAVIEVEAGSQHKGFWTEGKPLINFSFNTFKSRAQKHGIDMSKAKKGHPIVFASTNRTKYGSQQAAVQARLDDAMSIDSIAAIEGTFWGMFQIAGFNWKLCGAASQQDFLQKMSRSERDQLELFINFLRNTNLLEPMRNKDWNKFARGYNGASYASRGYHTKLARAYNKWKNGTISR